MLLAVTFIYIVLASQFESFTEPVIIMLALPLALVGALLMLLVTGQHLGMPAMIGIVMLMGLVTKNAILLVDLTNQLRREKGLGVVEAILQAGPVRLRPILMTTLAMVLGMLPSAFGVGEEAANSARRCRWRRLGADDIYPADAGRGAGRVSVARSSAGADPSVAEGARARDRQAAA